MDGPGPVKRLTPTVDVLADLLQVFTVDQLAQLARLALAARACSASGLQAEMTVRFIDALPRFMGTNTWEQAVKEAKKN